MVNGIKEKENKIFLVDPHASNSNGSRKDDPIEVFINKMSQVMNYAREYNADIYIPGDFTDVIDLKNGVLDKIIDFYKENEDVKTFITYGNHDECRNNKELRKDTALNLLFKLTNNLIQYPSCSTETEVFGIDYLDGLTEENIEKIETEQKVVMAHSFFNNSFYGHDEKENITKERAKKLAEKGVEILFLGHDHEEHKTEILDKLKIFRIGNLYRKHKKAYNVGRPIKILLVKKDLSTKELIIKAPPFFEVLSANKVNRIEKEEMEDKELNSLIEEYKEIKEDEDFLEILKEKLKEKSDKIKIKINKILNLNEKGEEIC